MGKGSLAEVSLYIQKALAAVECLQCLVELAIFNCRSVTCSLTSVWAVSQLQSSTPNCQSLMAYVWIGNNKHLNKLNFHPLKAAVSFKRVMEKQGGCYIFQATWCSVKLWLFRTLILDTKVTHRGKAMSAVGLCPVTPDWEPDRLEHWVRGATSPLDCGWINWVRRCSWGIVKTCTFYSQFTGLFAQMEHKTQEKRMCMNKTASFDQTHYRVHSLPFLE